MWNIGMRTMGSFGFFECINDQEVANALFDSALGWLRDKQGVDGLIWVQ